MLNKKTGRGEDENRGRGENENTDPSIAGQVTDLCPIFKIKF